MFKKIILSILLFYLLSNIVYGIECNTCSSCENYLKNNSYNEITLTDDLISSGTCINLNSGGRDNVILNCNNFILSGGLSGYGVYIEGYNFFTLKNCRIENFYDNIYFVNSNNNIINNSIFFDAHRYGLFHAGNNNSINNSVICSKNYDYDIFNDGENSIGYNNYCDYTTNHNDTGINLGCSFSCIDYLYEVNLITLNTSIINLNNSIVNLNTSIINLNSLTNNLNNKLDLINNTLINFTNLTLILNNSVNLFNNSLINLTNNLNNFNNSLIDLTNNLNNVNVSLNNNFNNLNNTILDLTNNLNIVNVSLNNNFNNLNDSVLDLTFNLNYVNDTINTLIIDINDININITELYNLTGELNISTNNYSSLVNGFSDIFIYICLILILAFLLIIFFKT